MPSENFSTWDSNRTHFLFFFDEYPKWLFVFTIKNLKIHGPLVRTLFIKNRYNFRYNYLVYLFYDANDTCGMCYIKQYVSNVICISNCIPLIVYVEYF